MNSGNSGKREGHHASYAALRLWPPPVRLPLRASRRRHWAIRLHGALVSSFRVCLSRTGRGGMSVLGRIPRKAVAAALFHKNSEKRLTILLRGVAAGLVASLPLVFSTELFAGGEWPDGPNKYWFQGLNPHSSSRLFETPQPSEAGGSPLGWIPPGRVVVVKYSRYKPPRANLCPRRLRERLARES